jgi:PKD repeat protein
LQVSDSIGCTNTDTILVSKTSIVIHPRFLMASEIVTGDTVQFINLSYPRPLTYAWDFGDGSTSTDTMPTNAYYLEGKFKIKLVIKNDFCSDSLTKTLTVKKKTKAELEADPNAPSTTYIELLDAKAYPNPTSGEINIEVNLTTEAAISIDVYSLYGTLIKRVKFYGEKTLSTFDLSQQKTGIYFFRIQVDGKYRTLKVIKI